MEVDGPTPSPTRMETPDVKSTKGRKLKTDEPPSKRQLLNRINGRNFRERKAKERAEMEQQLNEFSEILAAKNVESAALRATVKQLELENARLVETLRSLQLNSALLDSAPSPSPGCEVGSDVSTLASPSLPPTKVPSNNTTQINELCPLCAVERAKAHFHCERADALDMALSNAQSESEQLKKTVSELQDQALVSSLFQYDFVFRGTPQPTLPAIVNHVTSPITMSTPMTMDSAMSSTPSTDDLWQDESKPPPQTAESLFGPLRIEFARYAFKTIPGLPLSHIDAVFDNFLASTRTENKNVIRKCLLRSVRGMHKIMDACLTQEARIKVFEIKNSFGEINKAHFDWIMARMVDNREVERQTAAPGGYVIPERARVLNETLKALPSLAGAHDLIDEVCILFCMSRITPETFVSTGRTMRQLQRLCAGNTEDRALLLEAINLQRQTNHEFTERKMEDAIQELDMLAMS
ncbi:hypothetical protein BC830DRAFT_1168052 [Chytriomyces sp. MP71]|nr:hypothetical protein BC830DRAFT_1168052 [Chytriomyces sp. MP71]